MKSMRERRHVKGLREIRLTLPDPHSPSVRRRIADQVARLSASSEKDAMDWIEAISEFDEHPGK
jgi:hypothetical protein